MNHFEQSSSSHMDHWTKHVAVRLWTTLTLGSLAALVILSPVAGAVGPGWMIVPGLVLMGMTYWLTGIVFGAMGRRQLERLLSEATVWDRAGMTREARQALAQAVATADSFFFSPLSRKVPVDRLLAHLARFQLAQSTPDSSSDAIIGAYLKHFPRDRDAAVKWLDRVLAGRTVTKITHDIAAMIGSTHLEDAAIQRMLVQFYLTERRCDFAALQTYRQVMDTDAAVPDEVLHGIADLFLAQPRVDDLALQVYLRAYDRGWHDERLLCAIAACRCMIHENPMTRPLLESADGVLDGIEPVQRDHMVRGFLPEIFDAGPPVRPSGRPWIKRPAIAPMLHRMLDRLKELVGKGGVSFVAVGQRIRLVASSSRTKTVIKWTAMGVLVVGVVGLVVNTALHLADDFKTVEKAPQPAAPSITDPFTLQVAAYLNEADARRYVDQLNGQGLDAYWTRASGGSKTWYQVRIFHYKSKAEARAVGEDLKQRGLIGDYYVANYKRPDQ